MTSPASTPSVKSLKISPENHRAIHDLAARIDGNANDAISYLLGESTVRVPISSIQRTRWTQAAAREGVGISEFVRMRVEAAIQFGADRTTMVQIWHLARATAVRVGAIPPPVDDASTAVEDKSTT